SSFAVALGPRDQRHRERGEEPRAGQREAPANREAGPRAPATFLRAQEVLHDQERDGNEHQRGQDTGDPNAQREGPVATLVIAATPARALVDRILLRLDGE